MGTKSLDKTKPRSKDSSTLFLFGSQSRRAFSTLNLEMDRPYPESCFPLVPLSSPFSFRFSDSVVTLTQQFAVYRSAVQPAPRGLPPKPHRTEPRRLPWRTGLPCGN